MKAKRGANAVESPQSPPPLRICTLLPTTRWKLNLITELILLVDDKSFQEAMRAPTVEHVSAKPVWRDESVQEGYRKRISITFTLKVD